MRHALPLAALLFAAHAAAAADLPPRVTVFFASWSALLDPSAQQSLGHAAELAKANPALQLTVIGYASTIGSTTANTLLSRLRAQVVVDALESDGVAPERIAVGAVGATSFALDPVQSRRVEILLGAP
jgi:outer membrane protein OmpA-like peptidoglycan-associated protein